MHHMRQAGGSHPFASCWFTSVEMRPHPVPPGLSLLCRLLRGPECGRLPFDPGWILLLQRTGMLFLGQLSLPGRKAWKGQRRSAASCPFPPFPHALLVSLLPFRLQAVGPAGASYVCGSLGPLQCPTGTTCTQTDATTYQCLPSNGQCPPQGCPVGTYCHNKACICNGVSDPSTVTGEPS